MGSDFEKVSMSSRLLQEMLSATLVTQSVALAPGFPTVAMAAWVTLTNQQAERNTSFVFRQTLYTTKVSNVYLLVNFIFFNYVLWHAGSFITLVILSTLVLGYCPGFCWSNLHLKKTCLWHAFDLTKTTTCLCSYFGEIEYRGNRGSVITTTTWRSCPANCHGM